MNEHSVAQPQKASTPVHGEVLQRKCACGNHTLAGGECTECSKKTLGLQRKLVIGSSNDPLEQEADRIANQVMATPAQTAISDAPPRIQRFSGQPNGQVNAAPASVDQALANPGRPLEPVLRQEMEQRFGHDFSRVRVHSGSDAEQSAQDVSAHAYTVGQDIVFGPGGLLPGTYEGRRLLAHELTHVLQQSGSDEVHFRQSNERAGSSPPFSHGTTARQTHMPNDLLQRDTVSISLYPEETGTFSGSFKLPSGGGLFYYSVELNNVSPLMLDPKNRPKLDLEVETGLRAVLQELLKSNQVLSGLPTLRLRLDAGFSKALNTGHVERLVRRAARDEVKRLVTQSQKVAMGVVEAIVHMMSNRGVTVDTEGGAKVNSPRYSTEVKKSVQEPEHVALIWEWWHLATEDADEDGNPVLTGTAARARIVRAAAKSAPLVAIAKTDKKGREWADRYAKGLDELIQRAAREEVQAMTEAGVGEAKRAPTAAKSDTEEERIKSGAAKVLAVLGEMSEVAHRLAEQSTTGEKTEKLAELAKERAHYDEQLQEYIHKVFTEREFADAPELVHIKRASGMNFSDAIMLLKGGLDAVSAIMAVSDPEQRKEMFKARSTYFGTAIQGLEINALLWKFVSGAVAFAGVGISGLAKLAGRAALAEEMLDATVKGIGEVAGPLFLVGVAHGVMVLLDPEASPDEKAEAAVEATSSAVAVVGYASRWIPKLAGAARWSGPIAASLAINFEGVKYLARLQHQAEVGVHRVDWAPCFNATKAAAIEVQTWMRLLAVTEAVHATETDSRRKVELTKNASAFRAELVDRQLKPFVDARLSSKGQEDDATSCGPAFSRRLKPVQALIGTAGTSDDAALGAAATFLDIIQKAFADWDEIVMEKESAHVEKKAHH